MDDSGNVVIVAVVMLLGLLVTVAAIIHAIYAPAWKGSKEAVHMDEVCEDFKDLKMAIDIVASSFPNRVAASSRHIRMGGGELPLISPGKSGGTLRTDPDLPSIYIATDNYTQTLSFEHLGSIEFDSDNQHELDRTYVYENGGVIVEELNRSMMRFLHSITFKRFNNGTKAVTMRIINMSLENETVIGDGIANLELVFLSEDPVFSDDVINISLTIASNHSNAWKDFLLTNVRNAGFDVSEFDVTSSKNVKFDLWGKVKLTITELRMNVKIDPVASG
ncbi:MAG: hypothetical protein ACXQT5_06235 [Candidatus Syntropharchaeia archaeon]